MGGGGTHVDDEGLTLEADPQARLGDVANHVAGLGALWDGHDDAELLQHLRPLVLIGLSAVADRCTTRYRQDGVDSITFCQGLEDRVNSMRQGDELRTKKGFLSVRVGLGLGLCSNQWGQT